MSEHVLVAAWQQRHALGERRRAAQRGESWRARR
jgi:hypothetical protein